LNKKKIVPIGLLLLLMIFLGTGIYFLLVDTIYPSATAIDYRNTQYGFRVSLPASRKGYSIATDQWQGNTGGEQGDVLADQHPLISIRHPLWASATPRQAIPIMIFKLAPWDSLRRDAFHIGAAPIGPGELGRNPRYVFALSARNNYAFPAGWEEAQKMLDGKPLHAF
jgi:hypothetical protein